MLKSDIGHPNHRLIRCVAIGFDYDGTALFAREIELGPEFIDRNFLIAKLNCPSAGDTDDLVLHLWRQHEFRERDID